MPKTLLPFDHDKEAYSICVDLVWNKLDLTHLSFSFGDKLDFIIIVRIH